MTPNDPAPLHVSPISVTVRPLNERLWFLHKLSAAGLTTYAEEAELNKLCSLAEQEYHKGTGAAQEAARSNHE